MTTATRQQDTPRRDTVREQVEGTAAVRGVLLGLVLSIPAWIGIIAMLVWLL